MVKNSPYQRQVYLAFKNIFKDNDAGLRQLKKILKVVSKHQNDSLVKDLIKKHSINQVSDTLKDLLTDGVFESTLQATTRFPEIFDVSPAQSAERAVSEAKAAKHDADVIRNVAEEYQEEHPQVDEDGRGTNEGAIKATTGLLEKACYAYAEEHFPTALTSDGWECAQAVELNKWKPIFHTQLGRSSSSSSQTILDLLEDVREIRHTAVHRLDICANTLQGFLVKAETLTKLLLGDPLTTPFSAYLDQGYSTAHHRRNCYEAASDVSRLRRELEAVVGEYQRNKAFLEGLLAESRRNIAMRRAELDREEQQAVDDMFREDQKNQRIAGSHLERVIAGSATERRKEEQRKEKKTGNGKEKAKEGAAEGAAEGPTEAAEDEKDQETEEEESESEAETKEIEVEEEGGVQLHGRA
ncbi:MAG: hypothetical protein Q9165_002524 [Trypethelium subeluteriae]